MKIESLLAALSFLGGTALSVRILSQGIELALAAMAVEWSARRIAGLRRRLDSKWQSIR